MASVMSREAYFETGLDVLSDLGYGGLKLAEVCNRLGVTTGSFYHYFSGWPAYTKELVAHWMQGHTVQIIEVLRAEPDPRRRIDTLIQLFAAWGVYLLVGYEQAVLPRDAAALEWIAGQLTDALDSGRFASVPDGE
jgi:AcrR family transcriptional regulator